ncbi:tyrosine-type recombinase/integrase [Bacillus sp. 31A1R]|uniref:Tyrosine-type recombinase/integrase n=1 Tax=Robertmurraya mangrovi TaxID=3098077 RepID=A0ABU5IZT8_9BACI|nr:tyrosine-type recombinase/integrase [Bacillus sp. 31A1R]MDZ5472674.1 tyrosine-type recombinase/integrase [Bacillus sp. 31A1R]
MEKNETANQQEEREGKQPIEKRALPTWTIRIALEEMREYRSWEDNTYSAYVRDIDNFEDFCFEEGFEPLLKNISLHHVDKWIKNSTNEGVAYSTIKRRVASLTGLFGFYKGLGIITSNPFLIANIPLGAIGAHSRALELDEIVDVYETAQYLKNEEGQDVFVTIGVLFNTGLRGHALSHIKVQDVLLDKELIYYYAGIVNNKHKIQYFPIPPRLLEDIKHHIKYYDLQPEDQLLNGLSGKPLQNKQINFITNKINKILGWEGEKHVTPHGYRSSIATILDEREMELDNIKYLLGHTITKDNIQYYLRRDQRKIRALRRELTNIENEIYENLEKRKNGKAKGTGEALEDSITLKADTESNFSPNNTASEKVSIEYFIQLTKTNPQLAQKLAEMNLVKM